MTTNNNFRITCSKLESIPNLTGAWVFESNDDAKTQMYTIKTSGLASKKDMVIKLDGNFLGGFIHLT